MAALDGLTGGKRIRNVYRNQMIQVFRYAMELGWIDSNPAEVTRAAKDKRQRMRLSIEGYRAIGPDVQAAPIWPSANHRGRTWTVAGFSIVFTSFPRLSRYVP